MENPLSSLLATGANQTYDFATSFLKRKWAHDDRSHAENRQDDLIRQMWSREDALRQEQYSREDTAYQRTVADAVSAGLSPLAVTQTDGAGANISASMPSQPDVMSPNSYAQNSPGSSFNFDSAMLSQANLDELRRHNMVTETTANNQIEKDFILRSEQNNLARQQLDEVIKEFGENMNEQQAQRLQDWNSLLETLSTQRYITNSQIDAEDRKLFNENAVKKSERSYDLWHNLCSSYGVGTSVSRYSDYQEYQIAYSAWSERFVNSGARALLNDMERNPNDYASSLSESISISDSQSNSVSGNFNLGAGSSQSESESRGQSESKPKNGSWSKNWSEALSDAIHGNLGAGASANKSDSHSDNYSWSETNEKRGNVKFQQILEKEIGPMPVYEPNYNSGSRRSYSGSGWTWR